jgi:hypothetical protein
MLNRSDFIRAGNIVNAFVDEGNVAAPDVLEAIQTLKDGCVELIHIPAWIRKHYAEYGGDENGVSVQDLAQE